MKNKKELQKRHAKRRFGTRFGINLTTELHSNLVRKIQKGQAILVEKQSNRVSIFDIDISGLIKKDNYSIVEMNSIADSVRADSIRVVYDSNTKNIVTVLFKDENVYHDDFI